MTYAPTTGVIIELARALAFGMSPVMLMQRGVPSWAVRRAERYLGLDPAKSAS